MALSDQPEATLDAPVTANAIDPGSVVAWNLRAWSQVLGTTPDRVNALLANQDDPAHAEELSGLADRAKELSSVNDVD